MINNFYKIALATPQITIADCTANIKEHLSLIQKGVQENCHAILFPELSITGYSCGDLFWNSTLQENALNAMTTIEAFSKKNSIVIFVGLPLKINSFLYNCSAVIQGGKIQAIIPKESSSRWFSSEKMLTEDFLLLNDQKIPCRSKNILKLHDLMIGLEFSDDRESLQAPSVQLCQMGANILFNLGACEATIGTQEALLQSINAFTQKTKTVYIYSGCGASESTTDKVYGGTQIVSQNGNILLNKKQLHFTSQLSFLEIDLNFTTHDRLRNPFFKHLEITDSPNSFITLLKPFPLKQISKKLSEMLLTPPPTSPFIPEDLIAKDQHSQEIFNIQSAGLTKRLLHSQCKHVVIGVSGGLDSTLALLVCIDVFDKLQYPRKNILAVTMPGFGTSNRTYQNACSIIKFLKIDFKEISIKEACIQHFKDIDHDVNNRDVIYENSQARERTQILMDLANKYNGLVIGTGDLSELALGWATYNGDHLSMYGLNAGVPKTLVKVLVDWASRQANFLLIATILQDIINTPVSPELIPADVDGEISQKTEELVGPYELHDFFIYYTLRWGFSPTRTFFYAKNAFKSLYSDEELLFWLKTFFHRFLSQQFKRSCLPDGPQVVSISLSPRGALILPSDASAQIWLNEIHELDNKISQSIKKKGAKNDTSSK